MRSIRFGLILILLCVTPWHVLAQKIVKESLVSEGKKRTYYLYVPKSLKPGEAVPLIVLLHGSNHIGLSLAEPWDDLAEREGVIIAAPDSAESSHWSVPHDGPLMLRDLVESLKTKYPINSRKVYLFGHSGGAVFALSMALYESEYFAAIAIHAGSLPPESKVLIDLAKRKTPIHIQVGTVDEFFPLSVVRDTRDLLNKRGFAVELVELPGHNHWYYTLAPQINQSAWNFLKGYELPAEPRYDEYKFKSQSKLSSEAIEKYNKALKLHEKNDLTGAIAGYTRAIELDKNYADAYNNRGVAYMSQQNWAAAIADFTRSLEIAPSDLAYNNRGNIYFSQRKTEEAIADFTAGIKLKPTAEGHANRGIAYQNTNRDALALADFERAIELNPKFGRAYLLRAIMLLKSGKGDAAQKEIDKGFELDPSLHAEFDPMIKQLRPNQ